MSPLDFRWVLPGSLAGSAQPGLWNDMAQDMDFLRERGIRLVVTLTEAPLDPPPTAFGLQSLHHPIPDMGAPPPRAALELCRQIAAALERNEPALLHCKAGLGRTGALLACCLVLLGRSPGEAIRSLRRVSPHFIQTEEQERLVGQVADLLQEAAPWPEGRLDQYSTKASS